MAEQIRSPRLRELDDRYGYIVEQTALHGAWYRRALILLHMAEKCGGPDSPGFQAFLDRSGENWMDADPAIMRRLSEVPQDNGNT